MSDLPYNKLPGPGDSGPVKISGGDADSIVLARVDPLYRDRIALAIARSLDEGRPAAVDYQPGDMTRYPLLFTPLDGHAVREADGYRPTFQGCGWNANVGYASGVTMVSLEGGFGNCYTFNLNYDRGYLAAGYISEKLLDNRYHDSAVVLADLFTAIAAARNLTKGGQP